MWQYIFLGIIQGLLEWIPISSEGMVALTSQILEFDVHPVDMALFLHLGTFFTIVFYFGNDWLKILKLKNPKLLKFLLVSTSVSLIVGYYYYHIIKDIAAGPGLLATMGFGLLITAIAHKKKLSFKLSWYRLAGITGFLQGLAVIPGLSRSGATIFGLSLSDLKPKRILKISYMMSVPVVLASSIYLFLQRPVLALEAWPALISSFLTGILSLRFLMNLSQKINFFKFALIFSALCFLGVLSGLVV